MFVKVLNNSSSLATVLRESTKNESNTTLFKEIIKKFENPISYNAFQLHVNELRILWNTNEKILRQDVSLSRSITNFEDEILPLDILFSHMQLDKNSIINYVGHSHKIPDATVTLNNNILYNVECVSANGYKDASIIIKPGKALPNQYEQYQPCTIKKLKMETVLREERRKRFSETKLLKDGISFNNPTSPTVVECDTNGNVNLSKSSVKNSLFTRENLNQELTKRIDYAINKKLGKKGDYPIGTILLISLSSFSDSKLLAPNSTLYGKNNSYMQKIVSTAEKAIDVFSQVFIVSSYSDQIYKIG